MTTAEYSLNTLFSQLGLPDDDSSVEHFITTHSPLPEGVKLHEADIWQPSQAAFLKEAKDEDAAWTEIVDQLDVLLRD